MKARFRKCPTCPELVHRSQAVCRKCWRSLPAALQDGVAPGQSVESRRSAIRAIIVHLTGQGELPL